jgi:hypothetical protein
MNDFDVRVSVKVFHPSANDWFFSGFAGHLSGGAT